MDPKIEYKRLWKMCLGQVAGSLVMMGLGVGDVVIKCEECSSETAMPSFCLGLAIWLPAFVSNQVISFLVKEKKTTHYFQLQKKNLTNIR